MCKTFIRETDLPYGKSEKKSIPYKIGRQPHGTWGPFSTSNYIKQAVFWGRNNNETNRVLFRSK
jgi:hypothetical protein